MAPSRLMEKRRQDAVLEIAATALDLFSRNGFEATTVEAIAAEAGCSPRTFYRYFGSKEDVMFHDLPGVIDGLGKAIDGRLVEGFAPWPAVVESMVEFISRFDATDQRTATTRMDLWMSEPALLARYTQYIAAAEQVVVDSLCRYRGTTPRTDDLAQLIAVAAVGAYRITITTHHPARGSRKLTKHLRESLATLGSGLDR